MSNVIVLLMGQSGSGKTAVSKYLGKKYGWRDIPSYTTREPRYPGEQGHIFISREEFSRIDPKSMAGYTEFAGNLYCATCTQVDKADIYVIDPKGVLFFKKQYHGIKKPLVIYIQSNDRSRKEHMSMRGDSSKMIASRIASDPDEFKDAISVADIVISSENKDIEALGELIKECVDHVEKQSAI